jgi:hypothetical protein
MKNTQVKTFQSQKELNEFLSNHDVLNVQAHIVSGIRQSLIQGNGYVTDNSLLWTVWYKDI